MTTDKQISLVGYAINDDWANDYAVRKALEAIRRYDCSHPSNSDEKRLRRELQRIRWELQVNC